jgi:DNA-binding NarL/FixJ family response regulator
MHILLADDETQVRSALRLLLEQDRGLSVVGEAAEAGEVLDRLQATCPDLLLLDWELPGQKGGDLLLAVGRCCPALAVIALSGRPEARRAALAAGVDAFVSKGDPPERLLAAVDDCRHERHE